MAKIKSNSVKLKKIQDPMQWITDEGPVKNLEKVSNITSQIVLTYSHICSTGETKKTFRLVHIKKLLPI